MAKKSHKILLATAIVVCTFIVTIGSIAVVKHFIDSANRPPVVDFIEPEDAPPSRSSVIDLQPTVDAWAASLSSGSAGVLIYDLDNEQIVASLNADTRFSTESLYKLFVVYEGYRRVESGAINPASNISGSRSWAKCLDLAIRESHSPCAEAMRARLGIDSLNSIIKNDYNIQHTDIGGLTSTPSDIAAIMKLFYLHPEFSESTVATIKDSMLNQPPVNNGLCKGACDWRRGLPKGFTSGEAVVYNKVGWYSGPNNIWRSYHDAAIVEFPNLDRHYIVVVMTKNSRLDDVVRLGSEIEKAVLSNS